MQTLHILPALRNKLQDSDGTFNLRKERKKKTHQFYCLLDYIEKNTKICIKNINPACWTCMVIISILYHFLV